MPHGFTHGSYVLPWIGDSLNSISKVPQPLSFLTRADGVSGAALCREISANPNALLLC